jgi:23S rRNA (guanosine2251-2'-O)-methyltransferase
MVADPIGVNLKKRKGESSFMKTGNLRLASAHAKERTTKERLLKQQRPPQGFKGKRGSETPSGASRTSGPKSAGAGQFQKPSPRFIERETSRYDNPWRGRDAKAQEPNQQESRSFERQDRRKPGPDIGGGLEGPRHGRMMLYGLHAVNAALGNPKRRSHRLYVTPNALPRLDHVPTDRGFETIEVRPDALDRLLGTDTVHQGVALEVEPLAGVGLDDLATEGIVLVLDQITDPHNVGAILRSAAAFGVKALVVTERHSPHMTGVLAKTASGALEYVPIIEVVNLSQCLTQLGAMGFWRIGLDSEGQEVLNNTKITPPLALVLGAEGKGLRRLTRERCDVLARLDMPGAIKSLNVSNAAAISLALLTLR